MRHSRPGPRYTSYPTAPVWREDFTESARAAALATLSSPTSVYVHIPFCREQCWFCGCNMVVSRHRAPGTRYLDALEQYTERLALPAERMDVARIHLGGGTPTWLEPQELERLYAILYRRFRPIDGAEISVEADPEITTDEQVDVLAGLGVNRLSLGVQSFDPVVLAVVNRPQEQSRIAAILERARGLGMYSLNIDLIYGLPHQSPQSFGETLARTVEMGPDRLAVFGYAHVPWLKAHQRRLPAEAIPNPVERVGLFLLAHRMLTEAGYQAIGMDHFALRDDELAVAQRAGRLHRNFMGYTTRPGLEIVGLGMSAISEMAGCYVQDKGRLARWWNAVEQGTSCVEKGWVLTNEDRLRRDVINALMCNFTVRFAEVEAAHDIDFERHFAAELRALEPLEREGLAERHPDRVDVTELGRLLVRNVAMVFDAYLQDRTSEERPRFSQTV